MLYGPSDRLAEIDRVFDEALNLEPDRRKAFLASVAIRDPTLAADVERLLNADNEHDPPIDFSSCVAQAWSILRDAETDADRDRPAPEGTRFGAYRVVREIARGGMATVYLAERDDGAFEQQVALKLLPLAFADGEARRRLHRERKILARLQHPNVCRLLDGGSDEWGRPFLVMELVDGVSIDSYCDAHRLTIDERVRLVVAVAEAVASAHRNLIVHGDLKPSNILVTPEGRVKLLDFGIAKLLEPGETEGLTAGRLMTPAWASPEQLRGEPLSTVSDVFQLGLLLYELLVGRRRAGVVEGGRESRAETPVRPSALATAVPIERATELAERRGLSPASLARRLRGDLDTIVSKALEADPAARFDSAAAFADDLERHLAGRPILARPQTLVYRSSRLLRRHRLGAAIGAVAVAGIVAGAGTAAYQTVVAGRERAAAERAAARAAQVSDFLVEVFEVSAPERALGGEVTARELLDRGVQRIDQLDADPALRASLLETMGRAYRSHGSYDRAAALFERVVADRRAATAQDPDAIATALHDLGTVMHYQSQFDDARTYFNEALALRGASGNTDDPRLADTLHQRAAVQMAAGDLQPAEHDFREALAMMRRLRGSRDPSVATVLTDLGRLLTHQRRLAEAAPLLVEAVEIRRTALGSRHPDYSASLLALGANLDAQGRGSDAIPLLREAAEIAQTVYGPDHPTTLNRANSLATRLYDWGAYDEALTLFRRVHDGSRQRLGERHALMGGYAFNLGVTYYELRQLENAERHLRRALEIREATRAPHSSETLGTINQLALTLFRMGRHREAERLFERALVAIERASKSQERLVASVRLGYGRFLVETGRVARAAPLVEAGFAGVRARSGESSWRTAAAKVVLGRLRLGQLRPAEAARLWTEALDVLARDRPKHPVTAEVRELLARPRP
jgi:serine/threonine-protein kinase